MGAAGSAVGPGDLRVQKKVLKGERNTSISTFKEMDRREGELLSYHGVAGKQQGAAGGARRGSRSLCRAAGMGEGLCWLRGGLGAAQGAARRGGQSHRPAPVTAAGAGLWVRASPDGAGRHKTAPRTAGADGAPAKGDAGRGAWPRAGSAGGSLGISSQHWLRGFARLLSTAAAGNADSSA